MLELVPFLYTTLALGVTFLVVFMASTVILTVPVFATRGNAQITWFGGRRIPAHGRGRSAGHTRRAEQPGQLLELASARLEQPANRLSARARVVVALEHLKLVPLY